MAFSDSWTTSAGSSCSAIAHRMQLTTQTVPRPITHGKVRTEPIAEIRE